MAGMGLTFLNYRLNPKELAQIVTDAEATVLLVEPKYLSADDRRARRDADAAIDRDVRRRPRRVADVHYDELLADASDRAARRRRRARTTSPG